MGDTMITHLDPEDGDSITLEDLTTFVSRAYSVGVTADTPVRFWAHDEAPSLTEQGLRAKRLFIRVPKG